MHSVDIEALNQQIYIDSAFVEKLNEDRIEILYSKGRYFHLGTIICERQNLNEDMI